MTDVGKKWIQKALHGGKKGALHRQLGIPESETIPKGILKRIREQGKGSFIMVRGKKMKVTKKLKDRANFALNVGYGRLKK